MMISTEIKGGGIPRNESGNLLKSSLISGSEWLEDTDKGTWEENPSSTEITRLVRSLEMIDRADGMVFLDSIVRCFSPRIFRSSRCASRPLAPVQPDRTNMQHSIKPNLT